MAEAQLRDGEADLRDGEAELRDGEAELRDGEADLRDEEAELKHREAEHSCLILVEDSACPAVVIKKNHFIILTAAE